MYIIKKQKEGKNYYYLRKSIREKGKVKTKDIAYLGKTKKESLEKFKELTKKQAQEQLKQKEQPKKQKIISKLTKKSITFEEMAAFCKRRGFVYQDSEIYGSFAGFWDFGPQGIELKNNLKNNWWKYFILDRDNITGMDGSIITHPRIWEASEHITEFKDVAVVCKKCKKATKIDKSELGKVKCECGGEYESQGEFNLLFKTEVGALDKQHAFLRGETAQLIFADFKLIQENARLKLPFGIGQIGKVFRNEISPRDFLYRSREFEQMELQYFINPKKANDCPEYNKIKNYKLKILTAEAQEKNNQDTILTMDQIFKKKIVKNKWHAYWLYTSFQWFLQLGINKNNLRLREHKKEELAHYAHSAIDIEYNFSGKWKEIFGSHDRGQYDLSQHEKTSKKDMKIYDEETKQKVLPQVIESSFGVDRTFLIILSDAYNYDPARDNIVLTLKPSLAPYQIAVFPLINKLKNQAKELFNELRKETHAFYDTSGSIGKRYARQDEIGTPYCITFDFGSTKNKDVTIRDRNDTKQIRVKIKKLPEILKKLINSEIEFEKAGKLIN